MPSPVCVGESDSMSRLCDRAIHHRSSGYAQLPMDASDSGALSALPSPFRLFQRDNLPDRKDTRTLCEVQMNLSDSLGPSGGQDVDLAAHDHAPSP